MKAIKLLGFGSTFSLSMLIIFNLVIVQKSWALVDYSDRSGDSVGGFTPNSSTGTSASIMKSAPSKRGFKFLEFNTNFQNFHFEQKQRSGDVQTLGAMLSLKSPYSFFLQASYFEGKMDEVNREHKSSERGNPKLVVGSNWLQLGGPMDNARLDVYAGVSNKTHQSAVGSSRTDKIVGIETSKQIFLLMLGLGGQYILTGAPDDSDELKIGNISKATGAVGLVLTPDIRFSMEANYYRISHAESIAETDYALIDDVTFSTLGPKLILGLGQLFELELGAQFQTKRPVVKQENVNLLDAKLFSFPGAYGNSLFAGINVSV